MLQRRAWGKERGLATRYPLLHHLVDAAGAALVLWDMHYSPGMRRWVAAELAMTEAEARSFVALLAGLHDLGKAIPCFFDKSPPPGQPGWLGHDVAVQLTVPRLLNPTGDVWALSPEYRIGQLLGGHHGRFHPGWEREASDPVRLVDRLGGEAWHLERSETFETVRELLGRPRIPEDLPVPVAGVLTGLVIVADWLVSDTTSFIPGQQQDAPEELSARLEFTAEKVRGLVVDFGLTSPTFLEVVDPREIWKFEPNPLQLSLAEDFAPQVTGAGLLIITDSTGGGKTEAAYLGAHAFGRATGRWGLFTGLPTRATTDQAWTRLRDFAAAASAGGAPPVTLAHAMASFNDDYREDTDVTDFLRPLNRTLLAGLCAGTIDQVLLAALAAPFNMLRMHGLANKTVIIDEAHSYDPYMQGLLAALLSWCGRLEVPVILLSATLPNHISRALAASYLRGAGVSEPPEVDVPYPGWAFVSKSGKTVYPRESRLAEIAVAGERTVQVERRAHDRSSQSRLEVIQSYTDLVARDGGCIAVVCNTVDSAQDTYKALADSLPEDVALLLHSRFPQAQREEITQEVVQSFGKSGSRPERAVVVATQVIEQSLNLDFDLVISDIAPMSLLIQRLGRCWRFAADANEQPIRRPPWSTGPTLVVLDPVRLDSDRPTPPEWEAIYPAFEVAATHQVLAERPAELAVPGEVNDTVQQVHDAQATGVPARLRALWDARFGENRAKAQLARMASIEAAETITDLSRLTDPEVSDLDVSTRLGLDTARLIPRYTNATGHHFLDKDHHVAWPDSRPNTTTVEQLIKASIMCPREWAEAENLHTNPTWSRTPMLRDAYILPAPECGGLSVDQALGLVRQKKRTS